MMLLAILSLAMGAAPAGTITIAGIAETTADGAIPLSVTVGDLDGDGASDSGTLLLRCSGGAVTEALFHKVKSPRDSASGQASGKRTHVMPHVLEKSSSLAAMRPGYDLKPAKGVRMSAKKGYDAYQALTLQGAEGLCPAAASEVAKVKATKSRSNIQNN